MMDHLDPDQLAAIAIDPDAGDSDDRTHLEECARCCRELMVLREVSDRAQRARPDGPPPAPPEAVWERVVDELTRAGDLEPAPDIAPRRAAWRQPWAAVSTLIAVVVLAAAVLLTFTDDAGAVVAEAVLEPLAEVDTATAVLTADGEQRWLTVETPVLPDTDGYYELWLVTADGSGLVSLGPVTDNGPHDIPSAVDTDVYSVVDISREPSDGDPNHSLDSVLRGPLHPAT